MVNFEELKKEALDYPLDDDEIEEILSEIKDLEKMPEDELMQKINSMGEMLSKEEYKIVLREGKSSEEILRKAKDIFVDSYDWQDSEYFKKCFNEYKDTHKKQIEDYMKQNENIYIYENIDDAASDFLNTEDYDSYNQLLDKYIKINRSKYNSALYDAAYKILSDNVLDEIARSATEFVAEKTGLHKNIIKNLVPGAL